MSIAVRAERGRQLGATTEHILNWICKGGATTLAPSFCSNPIGLSVFGSRPSLFLSHRSLVDMLPRHASAWSQIHLSGDAHSFLSGCWHHSRNGVSPSIAPGVCWSGCALSVRVRCPFLQ